MVQDPAMLVPFFRSHIANNSEYNALWGVAYQQLVEQVQNEKPDFSEETIRQIWYERQNGVSSLMQGGMSWNEFEGAKEQLRELTRMMAEGCTKDVYDRVIARLLELKTEKVLNKAYWALCHRALAALYPSQICSVVNISNFFSIYNYLNEKFQLGLSKKGEWFERNLELTAALYRALGTDTNPIALNMSLWHIYTQFIETIEESYVIAWSNRRKRLGPVLIPGNFPKILSCTGRQALAKLTEPSILPFVPVNQKPMPV